ncbi:MAG: radical SAM protein, partial [Acidimicrobiales bacterium]
MPIAITAPPPRPAGATRRRGDGLPPRLEEMPTEGPLVDRFGRVHDDLRISVTDRCNLRCSYCMSEHGMTFLPRSQVLSFDEIVRVAGVAQALGVSSIRLTGGEPLVRTGLPGLVGRLAALGFDDLALTTNGMLLAAHAGALAAAGLRRVNISCDSLQPERFAAVRRRGDLGTVLRAMDAAEDAGLSPLKVNVVLL